MNPLVYGDYPTSMRILVGKRLPKFTPAQSKLLIGSYDFLGLNYYTAFYAAHPTTPPNRVNLSYATDQHVNLSCKLTSTSTIYTFSFCERFPPILFCILPLLVDFELFYVMCSIMAGERNGKLIGEQVTC